MGVLLSILIWASIDYSVEFSTILFGSHSSSAFGFPFFFFNEKSSKISSLIISSTIIYTNTNQIIYLTLV